MTLLGQDLGLGLENIWKALKLTFVEGNKKCLNEILEFGSFSTENFKNAIAPKFPKV